MEKYTANILVDSVRGLYYLDVYKITENKTTQLVYSNLYVDRMYMNKVIEDFNIDEDDIKVIQ
jgi:hypothetical protein